MISTLSQTFRQLSPAANTFSSGENSIPPPSYVRFRQQSSSFSVTSTSCASVARCVPVSTCPASLYEILGIPMDAKIEEIMTAYGRLARVCHPDVAAIDQKDSFVDEFMKIIALYRILISVPIVTGSFL
ncbi:hypothetical protein RND71_019449 [Anisodus tanguticus]|uniref:J domain-containing protein n=1 Tax=Anisodus tanguticus TaxID=243964 RepID=A0AAE1S0I2_9SOLA|nr:hypothetical protein RND71_019449 [Anisodus tanguticus]